MAPKSNVAALLAKFRTDQARTQQVVANAASEREKKLKKVQGGEYL